MPYQTPDLSIKLPWVRQCGIDRQALTRGQKQTNTGRTEERCKEMVSDNQNKNEMC